MILKFVVSNLKGTIRFWVINVNVLSIYKNTDQFMCTYISMYMYMRGVQILKY